MRSTKRRGEWAEAAFTAKALGQGLRVTKPLGDSDPYDFIVVNIRNSMNRVQVKSAWSRRIGRGYEVVSTNHHLKRCDFDFLVVALPEIDVWYVIPSDAVHDKRTVRLYAAEPKKRKTHCDYEPYREAWHLLTGDEPGAWERYQRFTIHANAE